VAGVYPVLADETCWFLAADFDGDNWSTDALAYLETCRLMSVPAALERSRSGEGGHVWIFFSQRIPARDARQLGATLLTETLERRPELGFASYDRMFPSQDTLPKGGFGNLIALPLQRRARDYGNSVFVDNDLLPYRDQWTFLASLSRLTPQAVYELIGEAEARDRVLSVRMPLADDNGDEPWRQSPSPRRPTGAIIQARRGQGLFRQRVSVLERRCRITGVSNPEHLRASHCKPWRDCKNEERLDGENGLLLTPSIDHLFDRGFIGFEATGALLISPVAHRPSLERMGVNVSERINVGGFAEGQRGYLEWHQEYVFLRSRRTGDAQS